MCISEQGPGIFFCKGPDNKHVRLCGPYMVSVAYSSLFLFLILLFLFSPRLYPILLLPSWAFWKCKTILTTRAVQKQAKGSILTLGHRLRTSILEESGLTALSHSLFNIGLLGLLGVGTRETVGLIGSVRPSEAWTGLWVRALQPYLTHGLLRGHLPQRQLSGGLQASSTINATEIGWADRKWVKEHRRKNEAGGLQEFHGVFKEAFYVKPTASVWVSWQQWKGQMQSRKLQKHIIKQPIN